jgi:signal transduction histidine kinase
MELQLCDDGNGFEPAEATGDMNSGSGIRNMKSRAILIGGDLEIKSNKDRGTIIKVILPNIES